MLSSNIGTMDISIKIKKRKKKRKYYKQQKRLKTEKVKK